MNSRKSTKPRSQQRFTRLILESLEPRVVLAAEGFALDGTFHGGSSSDLRESHNRDAPAIIVEQSGIRSTLASDRPRARDNHGPTTPQDRGFRSAVRPNPLGDRRLEDRPENSTRRFEQSSSLAYGLPSQAARNTLPVLPLSTAIGSSSAGLLDQRDLVRPTITLITITITLPSSTGNAIINDRLGDTLNARGSSASASGQRAAITPSLVSPSTSASLSQATSRETWAAPINVPSVTIASSTLHSSNSFDEFESSNNVLSFVSVSAVPPSDWQTSSGADRTVDREFFAASQRQVRDVTQSLDGPVDKLLSSTASEGGFIEIDFVALGKSRTSNEVAEEIDQSTSAERSSARELHDAFWFEFADCEVSVGPEHELADALAAHQHADCTATEDEPIGFEEGGMIVLTAAAMDEVAAAHHLATVENTPVEQVEIKIDPGIAAFHAVDVETLLSEAPRGAAMAATTDETSDSGAAETPSQQPDEASTDGEPLSSRREAASTSIILAIAGLFHREGRQRKESERKCVTSPSLNRPSAL